VVGSALQNATGGYNSTKKKDEGGCCKRSVNVERARDLIKEDIAIKEEARIKSRKLCANSRKRKEKGLVRCGRGRAGGKLVAGKVPLIAVRRYAGIRDFLNSWGTKGER